MIEYKVDENKWKYDTLGYVINSTLINRNVFYLNKQFIMPLRTLNYMWYQWDSLQHTVYPKKYAHGFCFAVLCCVYPFTDFTISIRLTSLALWQSNDCPSASKAALMNMDKYIMWIHYEPLHNHNKAKHNNTVCIFFGIYCILPPKQVWWCCICLIY